MDRLDLQMAEVLKQYEHLCQCHASVIRLQLPYVQLSHSTKLFPEHVPSGDLTILTPREGEFTFKNSETHDLCYSKWRYSPRRTLSIPVDARTDLKSGCPAPQLGVERSGRTANSLDVMVFPNLVD